MKKKVFRDLAFFMIGFGVFVGIVFPFFSLALGIPASFVLKPVFIISCILAGVFVGAFNIFLSRKIVGKRIKTLADKMMYVEQKIKIRSDTNNTSLCSDENCSIPVDSEDVIGDSARAFNLLVQSLSESYQTEEDIKNFNLAISSSLELDRLCKISLDRLISKSFAAGGMIIIEKSGNLEIVDNRGIEKNESILKNEIVWRVLRTNKSEIIKFPEDVILDGVIVKYRPKELLFIPIVHKEVALGLVLLASIEPFAEHIKEHLSVFIGGMSLALINAVTHSQLQELAANDALTNIFNRRFGMIRLQEEFSRAVRLALPIGVMMADIDFFKSVNDTYGHLVGDRVLIQIAQIAKRTIREGDIIIRYGGEEFLAILPGASRQDVLQVAERFRRTVEESVFHHGNQEIRVTISVGINSFPESDVNNVIGLIDGADKALYNAKDTGRNKVL